MDIFSVGIDMAKASFTAAAHGPAGECDWGSFANTPVGFEQWRARMNLALAEQPAAVLVVVEPTGGYELALAGFAAAQGWPVSRPNAQRVHDWAKSQGRRGKTDSLDARLLARYGASQPQACLKALPPVYSQLESLLQRQVDLDGMLHQERQRQAALGLKRDTAAVVASNLATTWPRCRRPGPKSRRRSRPI